MRTVLTPARRRRLERLSANQVTGGVLSASATAALAGVGLTMVSEVMGAVAMRAPTTGFFQPGVGRGTYPSGWQGSDDTPPPVYTSSTARRVPARVVAQRDGYRTAVARLVEEVRAVGGDGAVGVRVEHTVVEVYEQLVWRFLATGTAVTSTGTTRARSPFTSGLSAAETATAMHAGWVPVGYLACPVMAVRWVEPESRQQERALSGNGEVVAFSEAVTACRRQAGVEFSRAASGLGADGAVMTSMDVEVGTNVGLAEVSVLVTGTALARFGAVVASTPLAVLPVGAGR